MLIQNDYFDLFLHNDDVVIRTKIKGYPLKSFDLVTKEYPRLNISSFSSLRNALTELGEDHVIGIWLPLVEAVVSKDKLSVDLTINATRNEIDEKKNEILVEVKKILDDIGIVYGRKKLTPESFDRTNLEIAIGKSPINGADAVVTYIERPERKPIIREDGSANHYEMNFVYPVNKGDWLGERIPAQNGEDGIDVFGNVIPASKGNDVSLYYDEQSVEACREGEKIVLRALHDGALEFIEDKVGVGKHLFIEGDVGIETGSITFDGAVTVGGTVHSDYSVIATGDIEINGDEGITNAKKIHSLKGGIYIKGGVFGGGITLVEAEEGVFLKHANNCKLSAKELHVGLYLFGSEILAEDVFVDKNRGKIIGGTVEATFTIECATVGNNLEQKTLLHVSGIDKKALNKEIQNMAQDLKKHQDIIGKLKQHVAQFNKNSTTLSSDQKNAYKKVLKTLDYHKVELTKIDKEIQLNFQKVKNAQIPQIEVTREAFPGTIIQVENFSSILLEKAHGLFKIIDGNLSI